MSCGQWIQPCCPPQEACEDCHDHLTLTKDQDIQNRMTLDESGQVLNVPPPIFARRDGLGLSQFVPPGVFTPVAGLTSIHVDTTGGVMAPASPNDSIVIPRDGYYLLFASAGTQDLDPAEYIQVRLQVNGVGTMGAGETTRGLGSGGFNVSPVIHVPWHFLHAGDTVRLLVLTDRASGLIVGIAYVGAQYLEYPVW